MNFHEYQVAAMATCKPPKGGTDESKRIFGLCHASLGLASETGEFTSEVKRIVINDKPVDEAMHKHLVEELGDILWYCARAAEALDVPLNRVAELNIAKLQTRYQGGAFTPEKAEARADKGGLSHRES